MIIGTFIRKDSCVSGSTFSWPSNLRFYKNFCLKNVKERNISQETIWNTLRIKDGWLISVSIANFICFKGNSISHDKLRELISKKLKERKIFILKKKEMLLDVDPTIVSIFKNSNMVLGLMNYI